MHARKIRAKYDEESKNFSMDLEALLLTIKKDVEEGLLPFLTFCALGSTSCCGIDDIKSLSETCKQYNMLLAVDAAYAGVFLHLDKYEKEKDLLNFADFYQVNLSKLGFTGGETAMLFVADRKWHERAMGINETSYESIPTTAYKLGENTRVGIYKIYSFYSNVGYQGYKKIIEDVEAKAEYIRMKLANNARYEIFPSSKFGLVCFRGVFRSQEGEGGTSHRQLYLKKMSIAMMNMIEQIEEIFMVGTGECANETFLRISCNYSTSRDHADRLITILDKCYDTIYSQELVVEG